MSENGQPKTCSTCRHFHRKPTDSRGPVDLAAPKLGQCWHSPPIPMIVGIAQNGQPVESAQYPTLPEGWPACGQYEEKKALVV